MSAGVIRLLELPDAPDAAGEARAGLLLPPQAGSANTKPVLRVFATVSEAVRAKRLLEEAARLGEGAAA